MGKKRPFSPPVASNSHSRKLKPVGAETSVSNSKHKAIQEIGRAELEAELKRLAAIVAERDHPAAAARAAPPPHSRRAREKNIVYLTDAEIRALFRIIKSVRDTAIFRLAYHRGLRRSELGLLQVSDFREREGRLYSHRKKGSNSGEDKLFDEELRAMRAWIKQRGTAPGPLFPSRQGGPIKASRLALNSWPAMIDAKPCTARRRL